MTQVTFYILSHADEPGRPVPAHFALACQLAQQHYRQKVRVFILTDDQQQANIIDEYLWQLEPESFVPHNLMGEGPAYGAPVEIGWQPPRTSRQLLINLSAGTPAFANRFKEVIDFVPIDEQLKAQARARYKQYRQQGLPLQTTPA